MIQSDHSKLYFSHAISRTAEFLSCARTSLRILQQNPETCAQLSPELQSLNASDLKIFRKELDQASSNNPAIEVLHEATLTLHLLGSTLTTLGNLVKRRGTTNDPTEEINQSMSSFHNYSKGLLDILQNSLPQAAVLGPFDRISRNDRNVKSSCQRIKHYETVGLVLKQAVEKQMGVFKDIMTIRGEVLKEMALRRKQLNMSKMTTRSPLGAQPVEQGLSSSRYNASSDPLHRETATSKRISSQLKMMDHRNGAVKSQLNSPLFATINPSQTIPNSYMKRSKLLTQTKENNFAIDSSNTTQTVQGATVVSNDTTNRTVHTPKFPDNGMDYSVGYGGYGGYGGDNRTTGMRRRGLGGGSMKPTSHDPYQNEDENKIHDSNSVQAQIQMRRKNRQTQNRLESARQAEKTLTELTQMFGKMSNLIQSQGEILVKIEDDVEAAFDQVEAGKEELIKLHEWTSGNRGLIIKVFAILICLIIFMKFYG
jgi:hypothetical protein